MIKYLHVIVFGKVQGVFFRKSTKEKADQLSLTGWVKNLPDGSVEMLVHGAEKNLESFMAWCAHGPDSAEINQVDLDWLELDKNYTDFSIVD